MIQEIVYRGIKLEVWIDADWDNYPYAEKIFAKPDQNLVEIFSSEDLEKIERICLKP